MNGSWIRCRRPVPAPRLRLCAFAYAGGGATVFHHWAEAFGPEVEVVAVQLPGRQERLREPALRRTSPIIHHLAAELDQLPPAPLALLGVSFGGALVWELAARLVDRGQEPRLFLLASRSPALAPRPPLLHPRSDADFLDALIEQYGVSLEMLRDRQLWEIAGPSLRADIEAMETRPIALAPLPLSATLLVGSDDPGRGDHGKAAWSTALSGELEELVLPGGHFFVETARARVLAEVGSRLGS